MIDAPSPTLTPTHCGEDLPVADQLVRRVVARHFDPGTGTPFWLERAAQLGITDPVDRLRTAEDLDRLGPMDPADLRGRPHLDFLPRSLHRLRRSLILAQTGGTTGAGIWTAYSPAEFDAAFVRPFMLAADAAEFPTEGIWLSLCPSGPHVIQRAAEAIALARGAPRPFTVDLDPRWARTLESSSLAARRYAEHVLRQAEDVLRHEPVTVLFGTPPILLALAARMDDRRRDAIAGIHLGGMPIGPEDRRRLESAFTGATHLSGYGNSLLGCCLELPGSAPMDYFPAGDRLRFDVRDPDGRRLPPGQRGRVHATRLDDTTLLVGLAERDEAAMVLPPADAPGDFSGPGLRHPSPPTASVSPDRGLY